MLALAILSIAVALPGLVRARFGRVSARVAAALALAIFLVGVLDPTHAVEREISVRVTLVPTAFAESPALATLQARVGSVAEVVTTRGDVGLAERLAAACVSIRRDRVNQVVVLWTGPTVVSGSAARVAPGVVLVSGVLAPPIEPDECRVYARGAVEAERPAALEVTVPRPLPEFRAEMVITASDGGELVSTELDAEALRTSGHAAVPFSGAVGAYRFALRIETQGHRVEVRGDFVVVAARRVLVVGRDSEVIASALRTQGLAVDVSATLPRDLANAAVVVLLDPIADDAQRRLVQHIDDGGGLLLLGSATGGAFPGDGEPLQAVLPLIAERPVPASAAGGEPAGPGPAPPAHEPPQPSLPVPPTNEPPRIEPSPEPTPPVDPLQPPPSQGDTSSARVVDGPPVEVERRTVALVLVVDRSGSMSQSSFGVSKMQHAKTSAYETALALGPGDKVGVVTFGVNGQVVLPLTSAVERQKIRAALEALSATSESTFLRHALAEAKALVPAGVAPVRHLVVISDGEIYDASDAAIVAHAARAEGVTVSMIQIAAHEGVSSEGASLIANKGGGKFYRTANPAEIPRLVSLEVTTNLAKVGRGLQPSSPGNPVPSSGAAAPAVPPADVSPASPAPVTPEAQPAPAPPPPESLPREDEQLEVVANVQHSPLLEPWPDRFPPVGGVLAAVDRAHAQVLLLVRRGNDLVPLLAFGNRGLGRVAAWASDLFGTWGAAWRQEPHLPARLAQWVMAIMPPLASSDPSALVRETAITPAAPLAAERAALAGLTGSDLLDVAAFAPPVPGVAVDRRGAAPEIALGGALALVLVVLVEFIATRRVR